MNEPFEIPVTYRGQEFSFPARFFAFGYSFKIQVDVNGQEVLFEPDEERSFREVIDTNTSQVGKAIDVELLKAISHSIETIVSQ